MRGRIVDRRGPRALAAFALACAVATWALVLAVSADAPAAVVVALGALAGLVVPPLGPFTRAALGRALRERGERLQRAYGLDTAGEESALIVAPLIVALAAGLLSPAAALDDRGGGDAGGNGRGVAHDAGRRPPSRRPPRPAPARCRRRCGCSTARWRRPRRRSGRSRSPCPRRRGSRATSARRGVVLAAMAAGTVAGSLLAGRRHWRVPPQWRVVALSVPMAAGVALAATATGAPRAARARRWSSRARCSARCSRASICSPTGSRRPGSATRTFAWLVTANNGGLALGAAAAGALTDRSGADAGLWFGAACALAAVVPRRGTFVRTRTQSQTDVPTSLSTLRRNRFTKRQGIATTGGWVMSHWKN